MVGQFTECPWTTGLRIYPSFPSPPSTHRAGWIQPASAVPRQGRRGATFPGDEAASPITPTQQGRARRSQIEEPPPPPIPYQWGGRTRVVRRRRRRRRRRGSPPAEIHRRGSVTRGGIAIPLLLRFRRRRAQLRRRRGGGVERERRCEGRGQRREWEGGDCVFGRLGKKGKSVFIHPLLLHSSASSSFFPPLVIFRFYLFLFGDCSALCFVYIRQIPFVCFFLFFFLR